MFESSCIRLNRLQVKVLYQLQRGTVGSVGKIDLLSEIALMGTKLRSPEDTWSMI